MPITLKTSFDPGSFDPGKTYNKVKVLEFVLDLYRSEIRILVGRGYEDAGSWIWARDPAGNILTTEHVIRDIPEKPNDLDGNGNPILGTGSPAKPSYSTLVAKTVGADPGATIYDRAAAELYAWIITNLSAYDGTMD